MHRAFDCLWDWDMQSNLHYATFVLGGIGAMPSKTKQNKQKIDVVYVCRPQVERWTEQELLANSNLPSARKELEKRAKEAGSGKAL